MGQLVLDPGLRARLKGLSEQMEIRDEHDRLVGVALPVQHYKSLLANLKVPFSEEEIERRRRETGGCSLVEFWKKMGQP
jgi:hypothetical protein